MKIYFLNQRLKLAIGWRKKKSAIRKAALLLSHKYV
jgi:hypothetical protein